jgi:hypothetical protein
MSTSNRPPPTAAWPWAIIAAVAVLTALRAALPGAAVDYIGNAVLLAAGVALAVRGLYLAGLAMAATALWLLLAGPAHAAATNCPDALGNVTGWTVEQTGSSKHQTTNLGATIRRGTAGGGSDSMTLSKQLPAGCTITVAVSYDLALLDGIQGVPIAAAAFGGWSSNQTGVVGSQTGTAYVTITGPAMMSLSTWLSGTTSGHAVATLEPVLHRMSPQTKAEGRRAADLLDDIGTGLAVSASFIPDPKLARAMGLSAAASKGFAKWLQDAVDNDPPDPLYRQVARPAAVAVPAYVQGAQLRALLLNQLRLRELARTLYVTVNRANSAATARNAPAEDRQQGALDGYLHRIGVLLQREASLRTAAAPTLRPYGIELAPPALLAQLAATAAVLL